ncbi:hypothetical protein GHT06_013902 [Daphnia sinensis]|uniref:Uncharacterized protein n=1 Tax=Daphnia sinensis TaxID=1820382 RepID=A0AAD5LDG3_9CRUS|nr:hypothetical protein GHT06_013902 [Daphnia sinensis]
MKGPSVSIVVLLLSLCLWSCQGDEEHKSHGDRHKRFLYYSKKGGFGFGLGLGPKGAGVPAMTMVGLVEQPVPVHVGVPEYPSYPPPAYPPPPDYSPPSYAPPPPAYAPPSYAPPPPAYSPPSPAYAPPPAYSPPSPAYAPPPAY